MIVRQSINAVVLATLAAGSLTVAIQQPGYAELPCR
jgi:hypothetical protein